MLMHVGLGLFASKALRLTQGLKYFGDIDRLSAVDFFKDRFRHLLAMGFDYSNRKTTKNDIMIKTTEKA